MLVDSIVRNLSPGGRQRPSDQGNAPREPKSPFFVRGDVTRDNPFDVPAPTVPTVRLSVILAPRTPSIAKAGRRAIMSATALHLTLMHPRTYRRLKLQTVSTRRKKQEGKQERQKQRLCSSTAVREVRANTEQEVPNQPKDCTQELTCPIRSQFPFTREPQLCMPYLAL